MILRKLPDILPSPDQAQNDALLEQIDEKKRMEQEVTLKLKEIATNMETVALRH